MHYVYRFKDKEDNIIYIGYTNNIERRVSQHFGTNGHLSNECYSKVDKIEYTIFKTSIEAKYFEASYISEIKPCFNTGYINTSIEKLIEPIKWILFEKIKKKSIEENPNQTIKLEEQLTNEIKITEDMCLKINNDYYVGGKYDLFVNKSLKQIQYIAFCLNLCNHTIIKKQKDLKCETYMPHKVHLTISRKDFKVFRFLYGKHIKNFIEMDKDICIQSNEGRVLFSSCFKDNTMQIDIDTDILKSNQEAFFTTIWMGDFLLTKKKPSIYIKMKIYKFLDIQDYVEDRVKILISKQEFTEWTNCGHRYKQFILESMRSIDLENACKLIGGFEIKDNIVLTFTKMSIADHIQINGEIACGKYNGKEKTKTIIGTW